MLQKVFQLISFFVKTVLIWKLSTTSIVIILNKQNQEKVVLKLPDTFNSTTSIFIEQSINYLWKYHQIW